MDSPSVQSNSKCSGSDFSIKRILGDTRSSEEECKGSPSWLCCTRYQPPRLPRLDRNSGSSNSAAGRTRRSGRHARVPFTGAQAAALEAAYARAHYLAPPALRALAAALHLRDDRIKIWFQNRRAREKREKNGNVTPPKAVTLQPTTEFRVPGQQELNRFWNPLDPAAPIGNQSFTMNTQDSINVTSTTSYPILSLYKQPFSNSSANIVPMCDENRCESPLDIETVDS